MNINDFMNYTPKEDLPIGNNQKVILDSVRLNINRETNEVKGLWVEIEGNYNALYIPIFEGANYQLDFFLKQINELTPSLEAIAKHKGEEITVHRYINRDEETGKEYTNTSFNPKPQEDTTSMLATRLGK